MTAASYGGRSSIFDRLRGFSRSKFLRDSATLQVGAVLNAAGNFLSAVALAHVLGAKALGEFYVAVALYTFLWFAINQGLYTATVSQVAAAAARGQREKSAAWLAYLAKWYLILGLCVLALGAVLLPAGAERVLSSPRAIGVWAAWLGLTPVLELPRVVACAGLQGTRRMRALAQTENGQEVARVFLVVLGALIANSAVGPLVGTLVASAVGSAIALELYHRERKGGAGGLPGLSEILGHAHEVPFRHGLKLGVNLGLVRTINALGTQILPTLFMQRFGSSEWVTFLRVTQRMLNVPLLFMQGISRTALPMFSEMAGKHGAAKLGRTFLRTSLFSGLSISAGVLAALPFIPWLVALTFPANFAEPVTRICWILVPGLIVMSFSIANDSFYLATGTLRVGIALCVVSLFVNIAAVAVLAWLYPTVGVAWGLSFTMATSAIHLVYAAWWFRRRGRGRTAIPNAAGVESAVVQHRDPMEA